MTEKTKNYNKNGKGTEELDNEHMLVFSKITEKERAAVEIRCISHKI